jgi:hypothetical protein
VRAPFGMRQVALFDMRSLMVYFKYSDVYQYWLLTYFDAIDLIDHSAKFINSAGRRIDDATANVGIICSNL